MNTFKKVDLEDIHIFCKTAECSSFTEAAILIGTTPPSISKAIARLEKKLSLKLFIRSTRAMRLTEEGLRYYDVCKMAIENIQHVESELTNSEQPHGILKLTMPDSYGMTVLIPRIKPFFEKYKDSLKMEISLGNQFVNFTKEAFDLAIRIGDLKDDRVVAKYLHDTNFKLVASPEYLKIHGMPKSIDDLKNHQCIGLKFPELSVPLPWEFGKNNQFLPVNFDIVHSHSLGALDHAKLGLGITRLLDFSVQKELDEGSLIEVLPHTAPPALKVHLVYPSGFYLPSRIQLFMDYFQKEILPHLKHHSSTSSK